MNGPTFYLHAESKVENAAWCSKNKNKKVRVTLIVVFVFVLYLVAYLSYHEKAIIALQRARLGVAGYLSTTPR